MNESEDFSDYDPALFPPFAVTVDLVILTVRVGELSCLFVERSSPPFAQRLALPGGFVGSDEELSEAAQGKLASKTGVTVDSVHLEQLKTYGSPGRDPRMRVVSVAYLVFAANLAEPVAGPEALRASYEPVSAIEPSQLAFDHAEILADGIERARAKLEYTTLASHFLRDEFTLAELRSIYEAVWDTELDPRNFSRKVLSTPGFIEATGERVTQSKGRPARLYRAGPATELLPPIRRH